MKREMLCAECGDKSIKRWGIESQPYDGEFVKHVHGVMALKTLPYSPQINGVEVPWTRPCVCDQCNAAIPQGANCVARSMWLEGRNSYYPWEGEYLRDDRPAGPRTNMRRRMEER